MNPEPLSLFILLLQYTFSFSQYISIETQRHCTSAPSPQISFTQFLLSNTSTYTSIPITNYWNIQYYGPIYIGSSQEKMTVVYDTGSNLLWLPSPFCTNCRPYTKRYDAQMSTTVRFTNEKKNITYGIGSISGDVIEDSVSFTKNGPAVERFRLIMANEEYDLNGTIPDGVLGLGIEIENNTKNSLIYSLFEAKIISKPIFSFYLSDSRRASRLFIGDISSNTYIQKIKIENKPSKCYLKPDSHYWQCDISSIHLSNKNSTSNETFASNSKALFDTGTSYIIIPYGDYNTLMSFLISRSEIDGVCALSSTNQIACQCMSPRGFGSITLTFNDTNHFVIHFNDIIDFFPSMEYQCVFQIIVTDKLNDTWIIGDSALNGNLLTYDMEEKSVEWVSMKTLFNEDEMIRDDSLSHKNAIYYMWAIAGGAFLIILGGLAYYFMQ